MKKARRWVSKGIAALPIAVLLVMVVLWVRSYWIGDQFALSDNHRIVGVSSDRGNLWFYEGIRYKSNPDGEGFIHRSSMDTVRPLDRISHEYLAYSGDDAWGARYSCYGVPAGRILIIMGLLLARRSLNSVEASIREWIGRRKENGGLSGGA